MSTSAKDAPIVEEVPMQAPSLDIWDTKYRLKDRHGRPVDADPAATRERVARALAAVEGEAADAWLPKFRWALDNGAIPAGRIVANAGAEHVKPEVSLINCTVSRTIRDSMRDILEAVVDAGMTLKAGCVSPDTWVVTEQGVVSAEQAVCERHEWMLCYDREAHRFEMRAIKRHMTTHVPREENIELVSHGVSLKTSVRHPVLVHRGGKLMYVPAGEVTETDGLVHHAFPWSADDESALRAWFAGAHLGDGSAYEKHMDYRPTRSAWVERARAAGKRLIFKIRAAEREVVERYARFFEEFCGSRARVVANTTPNGTPVWDYTVASFAASRAAELIDDQIGKKTQRLEVPRWIIRYPERYFLPFLAGLVDTDGTVTKERGSVTIDAQNGEFLLALKGLLGLFGVNAGLTRRRSREHRYQGQLIRDAGGFTLKISDSAFLKCLARYMADSGKRRRIHDCASQAGMYDHYQIPPALRDALTREAEGLGHRERQTLGFYHGYHRRDVVSRVWLDRWEEHFPQLKPLLDLARCLRPVEAIRCGLDIGETFYDFTVDGHHNYLAGTHGLMVIHNCGIGYEFSTLRHKGAFVFGAGAGTNGPLAFMDIYDKMCFTVASAGGRRGAQMATFDVGHPDVRDFIEAKREAGRLRQFNLSLLITDEFMEAVRADADWPLAFPLHPGEKEDVDEDELVYRDWPVIEEGYTVDDQGRVACRIVEVIRARELWDTIMRSTYDFAEPGFILIDQVNRMNNNWFCEEIRATNPCVTSDTWVQTTEGPRQVSQLIGRPFSAVIDGEVHHSGSEGFFPTATKPVIRLQTREGYNLKLTRDHPVRRVLAFTPYRTETEWCAAGELRTGDRVLLNDHRGAPEWGGKLDEPQGYLLGLLVGDGTLKADKAILSVWPKAAVANGGNMSLSEGVSSVMALAETAARTLPHRADFAGWQKVNGREEYRLSTAALRDLALRFGMSPGHKSITPELEQVSSSAYVGFLRGFFDADGSVQSSQNKGVSVRLSQSDLPRLEAVQRMLQRLGIITTLYRNRRHAGKRDMPDGKGGHREYETLPQHELIITGTNLERFAARIGFGDRNKQAHLDTLLDGYHHQLNRERFVACVVGHEEVGTEEVYDVQVPGINTFDANGFHAHNCGEQPLPPEGACLLGSINLTRFVLDPFGDAPRFDWDRYRRVVAIFTRMLDNVVELSGLPLEGQRREIEAKRRHGMGFLGLGSALTMLKMPYGSPESLAFTEEVSRVMAVEGWKQALELSREKGMAPILADDFAITPKMLRERPELAQDGYEVGDKVPGRLLHARYSRYMQKIAEVEPQLVADLAEHGARFTHHSSIAPTGTISLSLGNNASNGIEPSFSHRYFRNVIRAGRKTKDQVEVVSFELAAYRHVVAPEAVESDLPDYFVTADAVSPAQHVAVQAAAQAWVDSAISKTVNVPTDFAFADFKDLYLDAYDSQLKGCTTFRFNPEAFQGVLVREDDLKNTTYIFELENGETVELTGDEKVIYEGEEHTAANLFDALKEGTYGKW